MTIEEIIEHLEFVKQARDLDADYYSKRSRLPNRHVWAARNSMLALHVLNAINELKEYNNGLR